MLIATRGNNQDDAAADNGYGYYEEDAGTYVCDYVADGADGGDDYYGGGGYYVGDGDASDDDVVMSWYCRNCSCHGLTRHE